MTGTGTRTGPVPGPGPGPETFSAYELARLSIVPGALNVLSYFIGKIIFCKSNFMFCPISRTICPIYPMSWPYWLGFQIQ